MRNFVIAAAALPALALTTWQDLEARDYAYSYEEWQAEWTPRHPGTEATFNANLATIRAHNADRTATWKASVNAFTGMTRAEFKHFVARGRSSSMAAAGVGMRRMRDTSHHVPVGDLPASLDWRTKGVVTDVKDQGGCGGCWSFSAAETMESAVAIATGKLMVFSEQALIDCTPNPDDCGGTGGCNGATQELAFNFSVGAGITTESDYPYQGVTGQCDMSKIIPVAKITDYETLPFNNYSALMNEVVSFGPVAISAAAEPWQFYSSGVFNSPCGADVDHAIQLVGYGTDSATGLDYYLVRNSWSSSWGEEGYIRIVRYGSTRKGGEPCYIDNSPGDGDGCNGGPSNITVCGWCGILSDSSVPLGAQLA